jgi:N-glycosylase/DNA lyase
LDLARCVASGQVFRWKETKPGEWLGVDGDHWYLCQQVLTEIIVESNGTLDDFRRLFRLEWDFADIKAKLLKRGPELAPFLEAVQGLRLLRPSDPVETLFSFLCSPNNHIARIAGMVNRLAAQGPVLATVRGTELRRFPEIEILAELTEQELRNKGFGYRAANIPHVARDVLNRGGRTYLRQLADTTHREARDELVSLKGVGPKLADCISLFALHHTESAPIDTHIWQAVTRLYFPEWQGINLTDKKYVAVADFLDGRFGELAGWAQQCLFYENLVNWRGRR